MDCQINKENGRRRIVRDNEQNPRTKCQRLTVQHDRLLVFKLHFPLPMLSQVTNNKLTIGLANCSQLSILSEDQRSDLTATPNNFFKSAYILNSIRQKSFRSSPSLKWIGTASAHHLRQVSARAAYCVPTSRSWRAFFFPVESTIF